jgi:hypothetical protein
MISGATRADAAVLVVDARPGEWVAVGVALWISGWQWLGGGGTVVLSSMRGTFWC